MADELFPGLVRRGDRSATRTFIPQEDPQVEGSDATSETSFGEATTRLMGENHIIPSIGRALQRDYAVEEDFDSSPERIQGDLEARGLSIPPAWYREFAHVANEGEYHRVLSRMEERLGNEQMIADMGGVKGTGAVLASYASDPAGFVIDSLSGFSTKGRMLQRFISAGSRSGFAEIAIQAALAADGETVDPLEVATGFGAAFVLGGGMGAAFGKLTPEQQAAWEAHQRFVRTIQDEDVAEYGYDSVGAARQSVLPDNPLTRDKVDNLNDLRLDRPIEADEEAGFLKGRFDATASMLKRARDNAAQKRLVLDLLDNPVTATKGAVNKLSAEGIADRTFGGLEGNRMRIRNKAFNSWVENTYQVGKARRVGESVFRGGKHADMEEQFNREVKRYIDSEGKLDVPDEVKVAAEAHLGTMKQYRQRLIDNGIVTPDQLSNSKWWFPRMMDRVKAKAFASQPGGEEALVGFFDAALSAGRRNAGLDVDDRLNRTVARAYVNRLVKTGDDGKFNEVDVKYLEEADRDFIVDLLDDAGVTADDLEHVLDVLDSGVKRAGAGGEEPPGHLQHRLALDLNTTAEFNGETIRLGDLFETDVEKVAWTYGRWASGEIALNQRGYSSRGMEKIIKEARQEASGNEANQAPNAYTKSQVKDLEWAYNRVMGRSLDGDWDENAVRAMRIANGVGYITKMGSGWINAAVESLTTVAMAGPVRVLKNMPVFRDIMKEVAGGNPSRPLVRQLNMLAGGIGQTLGRGMHSVRHQASEFTRRAPQNASRMDKFLSGTEDTIEGLKRGASWTNMLALFTDYSRQMTSVVGLSQLDDILVRGKRAPSWFGARSRSWGLDEDSARTIKGYLSSDNVTRSKNGALTDLGNMPADVEKALGDYIYKYTAEAIQDIQGGNLPKWMQNPLGRMVFQFRSFTTAAWVRHTLKDLKHGDTLAAMKFMYTGLFATLAYTGRQLAFTADEDKRNRNLEIDRMLEAGFTYAVNASILPAALSSATNAVLGEPLFEGVRTSGLDTQLTSLGAFPAAVYAGDVMQSAQGISTTARGGELSKNQFKAMVNIAGLDTIWALRPFTNRLAEEFPSDTAADTNSVDILDVAGLKE